MIRLIFVLRRTPSMSREQFQKYWHEVHGPLVAKHATTLSILRYVQDHTLDDPMNEQMARARGGNGNALRRRRGTLVDSSRRVSGEYRELGGAGCRQGTGRRRSEIYRPAEFTALARLRISADQSFGRYSRAPQQRPGEDFLSACVIRPTRRWSRRSSTGEPIMGRLFGGSREALI